MPLCKRTIGPFFASAENHRSRVDEWIDLASVARVEITSEDPQHPIEEALLLTGQGGWRAAGSGEQMIRLIFDRPTHLRRIQLVFDEPRMRRTQEFALHWSSDGGR